LVISQPSRELSRTLMYYISEVSEVSDETAFIEATSQAAPSYWEDVMTIAQRFEQRVLQQGGHDKAFEISRNMLDKGMSLNDVKELTELADQELSRLH
jgi:predicted transposase YdaD